MLDFSNINSLWGSLVIEECIRNGCDYFCVSPGSRSTPLTVAVARNPRAKKIICYDERGAAFHALGYARATGRAAVLICSSGTAAANYLPAAIEAGVDGVPMLILSADRPPELRDTMANQTITQPGIFANYARWFFDMPVPTEAIGPQMPLTTVDQALYRAHSEQGPVHMNFMFRMPLEPVEREISAEYIAQLDRYQESGAQQTVYRLPHNTARHPGSIVPNPADKGIVIVGQLSPDALQHVVPILTHLGWPVLPDITSQLRLGNTTGNEIHYFDQLLLEDDPQLYPDVVIQLGGQFVSKRLLQFLKRCQPREYIVINERSTRFDANHQVTYRVQASLEALYRVIHVRTDTLPNIQPNMSRDEVAEILGDLTVEGPKPRAWLALWQQKNSVVRAILNAESSMVNGQLPVINEGVVGRSISAEIPHGHALFVGNSMPIRDVDMFAVGNGNWVPVAANRGASGIDGNLATAIGYAVGHDRPTTLLLGDLTLLHDLNSLSLLRYSTQPLTIVVINNSGGGIFHMLPIRQFEDVFEENFGTPHGFQFEHAAKMFDIDYAQPQTLGAFIEAYRAAVQSNQHTLIEVQTDRETNHQAHIELANKIRAALSTADPLM